VLISFEGIDGCGKSTQIRLLTEWLDSKNLSYHLFREPGGTEISEKIRSLLLHETEEMHPVTELLLFSAARSQLIHERVQPLLESGEIVLLDRFYDSTTAYQGFGRKSAEIDEIEHLHSLATHGISPDLTFYLRLAPEIAMKRTGEQKDRMEKAGLSFFRKVSEGYDQIASREERFVTLDSSQPKDLIHRMIVDAVKSHSDLLT
jgi:dTMP kinase